MAEQSSSFKAVDIPDSTAALCSDGSYFDLGIYWRMDAEQGRFWTQPVFSMFTVLKYMAPLALALAGLKYQGNTMNVFDENPVPVWCLLIATWFFFLTVGALKANFPRLKNGIWFDTLIFRAGIVCGLTSIMSSISIFIPRRYSFLPLVPVVAAAVFLAWPMLHHFYNWIVDLVNNTFDNIRVRVANCWGFQGPSSSMPV